MNMELWALQMGLRITLNKGISSIRVLLDLANVVEYLNM